ncbi:MAG: hypothetical protein JRI28_05725, partial [Deltaproteobacteria bacterium]|nr:hypothetical protein [Deltaproteobacteria bacterium]
VFIEHHIENYTTDIIAQVLQKVLDKMNMAAGLDGIIMDKFDFWRYASQLIRQIKARVYDKPDEEFKYH